MILVGSQRGGARDLAIHLIKPENEHVELYELRGFAAATLRGALEEARALSMGTRCRQFLYSLSVNPPVNANVSTPEFIKAIDRAEKALGLDGQSRAIVFHEKEGPGGMRRHAHVVWSRIDADTMTAVPLPFTKRKLTELTRDLYIEHGWEMPAGLIDPSRRDPRNFTLAEWQQAKRQDKDPRAIKSAFQDAWALSDSPAALKAALEERGYNLARGDRRAFVVIDHKLEPYALHKWLGLKVRDVRARLGDGSELPSVDDAKAAMSHNMDAALQRMGDSVSARAAKAKERYDERRLVLVKHQRSQRAALSARQESRRALENQLRQARFRKGLAGVWDRLRGQHGRIAALNARESEHSAHRDQNERDALVSRHLSERRRLGIFKLRLDQRFERVRAELEVDRTRYAPGPEP